MNRIVILAALSSILSIAVSPVAGQGTAHGTVITSEPTGWIGVYIQMGKDDAGNTLKYPVITSVQPNSPADSAGLTVGDTVLKFGHIDAHAEPFGLKYLLQPGRHIKFKVQHNGIRTRTVVPRAFMSQFGHDVYAIGDISNLNVLVQKSVSIDNLTLSATPIAAPANMRGTTTVIAGASLVQMSIGLSEALNVQNQGVLVLQVAPATPAMRAGLKDGDIILRADAVKATSPVIILQAVSAKTTNDPSQHNVVLDVVRKGQERQLTLRW